MAENAQECLGARRTLRQLQEALQEAARTLDERKRELSDALTDRVGVSDAKRDHLALSYEEAASAYHLLEESVRKARLADGTLEDR